MFAAVAGFRGVFSPPLGARALLGASAARGRVGRAGFSASDRVLFRFGTDGWFALADASRKLDARLVSYRVLGFYFFQTRAGWQAGCPSRRASAQRP